MTSGPGEQPDELLDEDAPAGTPVQDQVAKQAADVWCAHGVRWQASQVGYVADDAGGHAHYGHDVPAQEPGAIPCQPTYASHAAWERLTPARRVYEAIAEEEERR